MLSRRDFIKAGAATAASHLVHPLSGWSSAEALESFSFGFFSDTHVGLRNNLAENREMFTEIAKIPLDFAINGGDVTEYGWLAEYANYRELLKSVPFEVRAIPGNHDVRWSPLGPKAFRSGTDSAPYASFDHKGLHLALLDSTIPLSHYGHFESEMLRWLEEDLRKVGRETPVVLASHHWVGREGYQVDNEAALLELIRPYNVKHIFTGHGHLDLFWTWNGIPCSMNKGLYQGSYLRVNVNAELRELTVWRRTKESPTPTLVVRTPLGRKTEAKGSWFVPPSLAASAAVKPGIKGAREYRWDDGKWLPIPDTGIPTRSLATGAHRLTLRKDAETYFHAGETAVRGSGGALHLRWERKLTGGVMSHLRLADGVLYVSAMDGSLNALRARDGYLLWTAKTRGYCHSSPLVLRNVVIVGSADGNVYAFERTTGKLRWRVSTGGPVYASAAEAKGVVAIGSGDGRVYGLAVDDGQKRWTFELPPVATAFTQSPVATDGDRFFLGAWDTNFYALDARTGERLWSREAVLAPQKGFAYSPAIGAPAVGSGRVYVPSNGNVLWALDSVTGEVAWTAKSPGEKFGYSSPCLVGDRLYIGCLGDTGETRCVSAANGEILWTTPTGSAIYDSSFSHAAGVLAIGSVSGLLSALSAADGKILGQYRLPSGHFLASPVSEPGRIYAASLSDHVMAFDVA